MSDNIPQEVRTLAGNNFSPDYVESVRRELESRGWQPDSSGDADCVDEVSAAGADIIRQQVARIRELEQALRWHLHGTHDSCCPRATRHDEPETSDDCIRCPTCEHTYRGTAAQAFIAMCEQAGVCIICGQHDDGCVCAADSDEVATS